MPVVLQADSRWLLFLVRLLASSGLWWGFSAPQQLPMRRLATTIAPTKTSSEKVTLLVVICLHLACGQMQGKAYRETQVAQRCAWSRMQRAAFSHARLVSDVVCRSLNGCFTGLVDGSGASHTASTAELFQPPPPTGCSPPATSCLLLLAHPVSG